MDACENHVSGPESTKPPGQGASVASPQVPSGPELPPWEGKGGEGGQCRAGGPSPFPLQALGPKELEEGQVNPPHHHRRALTGLHG